MRYRLWCEDNNGWEQDQWVVLPNGLYAWVRNGEIIPYTPGSKHMLIKGSGIRDENGQEMFELDIVEYTIRVQEMNLTEKGIVLFDDGLFYVRPLRDTKITESMLITITEKQKLDILRHNKGIKRLCSACDTEGRDLVQIDWTGDNNK